MLGSTLISGMSSSSVLMKDVTLSQKEDKFKEVNATQVSPSFSFISSPTVFSGYTYLCDGFHHLKKRDTRCLF